MNILSSLWGGDPGIAQTVTAIKNAIYASLRNPQQRIRARAESIIRNNSIPERDEGSEIKAVAQFVQDRFHYIHDPTGLEYVKAPEVIDDEITRYGYFLGDCDDAACYLGALLKSLGFRTNLTVIANPKNPTQNFSHIYVQAYSTKLARWITLDMTAKGKPLGWGPLSSRFRSYEI
jgi:hypothetical protein